MTRNKLHVLTLAIVATLVAGPALAGWPEGVAAFRSGDLNTAVNEFKAVVDAQPDWPGGHYMLGRSYLRAKKNQEAITHLRKAYDLDKGNVEYQLFLGEAYIVAGRHADGASLLNKVDESKLPKEAKGRLAQLKMKAYKETGQSGQLLAAARSAAEVDSGNAKLWHQYGILAYNEGQNDTAVSALQRATRLDPNDAAKQLDLARALLKKGRTTRTGKAAIYQQAAAAAQKAVAVNASTDNLTLLGECHLGAKSYDEAIAAFEKAANKSGSSWLQHYYIGQAYTAKERYKSAESSLETALDNAAAPTDKARVWKQLAFVYEKQKNFDRAIDAYTRAGDSGGAERARTNRDTEAENRAIDAENRRLEEMEAEKKRLEQELKNLPGGPPPRF